MSTIIQPYLFFQGRCEEALEFYRAAIGAEIEMLMRFKEAPDPPPADMLAPGYEEKIMHSSFRVGESVVMASDGCGDSPAMVGFSLSLNVPDEAAARKAFDALADGGSVTMPLDKTFWSPCFGMLTDRFGVGWMVGVFQECQGGCE
jgi:PhnB protein